jgi:hypothetical protein
METGFDQLMMRYPASDYILNGYANVACRAGDKAQYQKLRQEVGHRFSAAAWTSQYSLASCDKRLGKPAGLGQQLRHPISLTALGPPLRSVAGVIPNLVGLTREELAARSGGLAREGMQTARGTFLEFRNGVVVLMWGDKTNEYGVYALA